ncbi:Cyclopropane-fatty-acyl-phospholipid synthase [Dissulfuribacter thermophilus]|uniref:Cyclopropane-fatty-acyl-phospholipid synthase n=1 Tax=Dissulfuribacter thermophilus TaxID=1156395 RepID=A0A1B9F8G7_9BACT|nr:cyclopropane-fatty-acyl-phospholipid synthase family protein [Dissulfuribacter thermophilus]OCC16071.1 Cyclopropane-fatty-acyl-phospholipid synthase [Dissulfuribacter thermophilus]
MEAKQAQKLFESLFDNDDPGILIKYWDGSSQRLGGEELKATISIKNPKVIDAIISDLSLGFGEAYMRGELEVEGDLGTLLYLAYSRDFFSRVSLGKKVRLCWLKFRGRHGINQCKRDIKTHYDRGNQFYRLWLDQDMNYSCAYFKTPDDSLEQAQLNKNLHVLHKLQLSPGERLLDIGCGWGALIRIASERFGAKAVGLTLSHEQMEYGKKLIEEKGLQDRCEMRLQDYREVSRKEFGTFDKLVSVGMFEHVGREKYKIFFKRAFDFLKDEGLFLLHTISRMKPADTDPWICTYIFPGGYIPAIGQVLEAAYDAGFKLIDIEDLRRHYDLTLGHWLRRFEAAKDEIEAMKGEEFVRMWRLYLIGSQMSFRAGGMYVSQFLFSKGDVPGLPLTRKWMHC